VDEALPLIKNNFITHWQNGLSCWSKQLIIDLLEVGLSTIYIQVEDKIFQQTDSMAMGSTLSPLISNINMVRLQKLVPGTM
jgi:hypothetical protein